jgi:hypothetical protein
MASPYCRPGYVDHRTYDHTSILRFLEWRFLGAPPEGPGAGDAPWALSARDRHANNLGASLAAESPDPELFDLFDLPLPVPLPADCKSTEYVAPLYTPPRDTVPMAAARASVEPEPHGPGADLLDAHELGFFDRIGASVEPSPIAGVWAEGGSVD